jgi:tRNA threonylcarbamoyladenosine biosynthesis protein TsaE
MKYLSHSLAETNQIALDFLAKISQIKNEQALVVALFGDLGSGKTTFTQALGKNLGVQEVITSPTFVIEKRYEINQGQAFGVPKAWPWLKLIHIDAYRLDSAQEILNLNFREDIADKDNLILIEWPERVDTALPEDILKINFTFINETEREIEFE